MTARLAVLVNDVDDLEPGQTTTRLVRDLAGRYGRVDVTDVARLGLDDGARIVARARRYAGPADASGEQVIEGLRSQTDELVELEDLDGLLLRTNPGRADQPTGLHDGALGLATLLAERGVPVLNHPLGLLRAASKLYLSRFPAVSPRMAVTHAVADVLEFARGVDGPIVVKPLRGSGGDGVFLLRSPDDCNLRQITEMLFQRGFAIVQEYLPEAADGDTRVLLVEGHILEVDGHSCAFRRVPGGSDFRSNLYAGGRAAAAVVGPEIRAIAAAVGPGLAADGIYLAGIDIIGTKVIEINVWSPGGLNMAESFEGVDFSSALIDAIEKKLDLRG